jgi:hypothetical protein
MAKVSVLVVALVRQKIQRKVMSVAAVLRKLFLNNLNYHMEILKEITT